MTLKDELMDLAEKVKAATGPDRELDAEVARAVGLELQVVRIGPDYRRERLSWIDRNSGAAPTSRPVPSYTASIDDAKTLWPGEVPHLIPSDPRICSAMALRTRASIKGSSHVDQ